MERKIKIKTGLIGDQTQVMVDDIDISDWVKGFTLKLSVGDYNDIEMNLVFPTGTTIEFDGKSLDEKLTLIVGDCPNQVFLDKIKGDNEEKVK